jgi:tetratricopeptide (TPR) repeat protein
MGGHDLLRAWLLNDHGAVLQLQGQKNEALRLNLQSVALKDKVLGSRHPDVSISEGNLAIALTELGRHQEALVHIENAVAIAREGLGAGHPELALHLYNRGEILRALGRRDEARGAYQGARAIWERELGSDSPFLSYTLTGIGQTYLEDGDADKALVPLERAFKLGKSDDGDSTRRAETSFALARALWSAHRDRGRARALAEEAKVAYAKTPTKDKLAEIDSWLHRTGEDTAPPKLARR